MHDEHADYFKRIGDGGRGKGKWMTYVVRYDNTVKARLLLGNQLFTLEEQTIDYMGGSPRREVFEHCKFVARMAAKGIRRTVKEARKNK